MTDLTALETSYEDDVIMRPCLIWCRPEFAGAVIARSRQVLRGRRFRELRIPEHEPPRPGLPYACSTVTSSLLARSTCRLAFGRRVPSPDAPSTKVDELETTKLPTRPSVREDFARSGLRLLSSDRAVYGRDARADDGDDEVVVRRRPWAALMKLAHIDDHLAAEEILDAELKRLPGQWVAIDGHKIVASCSTAEELYEMTADLPVERRLRVPD